MKHTAPVILFVYNRLEHTRQTVEALQKNFLASESELYIYSDAAKNSEARIAVDELRLYLRTIRGFRSVHIELRETNLGVDENIISGVTEVIKTKGRVIVLEDDLVTSPWFLKYMNEALDFYEEEEKVISIHGYTLPVKQKLKEAFFLKGADCWGWATWTRGWDLLELDGKILLNQFTNEKLKTEFNFNNTYDYIGALKRQADGETKEWDIRWYATAFLADKLTLYPGSSLVKNIGHDASGSHCGVSNLYDVILSGTAIDIKTAIVPDKEAYLAFANFFSNASNPAVKKKNWVSRIFKRVKAQFAFDN
ncbi:MAG: glycosyltransferase family 2 protein [Pedobacter sp.]|nr:glycosyltransferase family 2 protein [Pedobacter sp.]